MIPIAPEVVECARACAAHAHTGERRMRCDRFGLHEGSPNRTRHTNWSRSVAPLQHHRLLRAMFYPARLPQRNFKIIVRSICYDSVFACIQYIVGGLSVRRCVFAPVGRERDADSLENLAELAGNVGAGGDAFASFSTVACWRRSRSRIGSSHSTLTPAVRRQSATSLDSTRPGGNRTRVRAAPALQ